MLFHRMLLLLMGAIVCAGCQSSPFGGRFAQTVGYRDTTSAREDPASQSSDPWVQDVGQITRKEYANEKIVDPLKLRDFFVSEKAQDIERNLGVGD